MPQNYLTLQNLKNIKLENSKNIINFQYQGDYLSASFLLLMHQSKISTYLQKLNHNIYIKTLCMFTKVPYRMKAYTLNTCILY